MKRLILLAALPLLALGACGNSDNTTVDADGNTITPIEMVWGPSVEQMTIG